MLHLLYQLLDLIVWLPHFKHSFLLGLGLISHLLPLLINRLHLAPPWLKIALLYFLHKWHQVWERQCINIAISERNNTFNLADFKLVRYITIIQAMRMNDGCQM